MAERSSLGLN